MEPDYDKLYETHFLQGAIETIYALEKLILDIEEIANQEADYCTDYGMNNAMLILSVIKEYKELKKHNGT